MKRENKRSLFYFIVCLVIIALTCASCKTTTKIVEVPVEVIKTEYIHKTDSFIEHDSVWELIEKVPDTVKITKYKEKVRTVVRTDTVCRTDTIPKVIKVTEIVEVNKLKKWQKILMYLGGGFLVSILTILIYKLRKWRL